MKRFCVWVDAQFNDTLPFNTKQILQNPQYFCECGCVNEPCRQNQNPNVKAAIKIYPDTPLKWVLCFSVRLEMRLVYRKRNSEITPNGCVNSARKRLGKSNNLYDFTQLNRHYQPSMQ